MKACVIIVNWNGLSYLEKCLTALRNQSLKDFKIILVDNASTDGSLSFVEDNFKEVDILELNSNTGFVGGNNAGIEYSIDKYNPEFIITLNNDTWVDQSWFSNIIKPFSDKRVAIVTPLILLYYRYWLIGISTKNSNAIESINLNNLNYKILIQEKGKYDLAKFPLTMEPKSTMVIAIPFEKLNRINELKVQTLYRPDMKIQSGSEEFPLNIENKIKQSLIERESSEIVQNAGTKFNSKYKYNCQWKSSDFLKSTCNPLLNNSWTILFIIKIFA